MKFRPTRIAEATVRTEEKVPALVALSYELLDAHADTTRLSLEGAGDDEWQHHLSYLRDLQRVGREALARADMGRR